MNKLITTLLLCLAFLFAFPQTAFAQSEDGGVEAAVVVDAGHPYRDAAFTVDAAPAASHVEPAEPPQVNPAVDEPGDIAKGMYEALRKGHYLMAFGGLLMFLVWLLRWGAVKVSSWFETKLGGFTLAFATSFALTLGEAFWAGHGFSLMLFGGALSAAWMAAGQWGHLKDALGK